jgi:serine protease AprX
VSVKRHKAWTHALALGIAVTTATAVVGPAASEAQAHTPGGPALLKEKWGDDTTGEGEKAAKATGSWNAAADLGSVHSTTKAIGAQSVWKLRDAYGRTLTGKGVDVAVIDTGVSPVEGLDAPGKIVNGPDLSYESQSAATRYLDGYGHGTHMAAIIAGRDVDVRAGGEADAKSFVGIAPDARILNMKAATGDGGGDVSQVIAAVDWVVRHRRDNGLNVRVINLSYGTRSPQSYTSDPLARAVENAWRAGIVVVVAAGNDGETMTRLTMPAADPYVIAVGASDHLGTGGERDDRVTEFTNPGTSQRRLDLLAPGKSVVSLRVPGSLADQEHPEGRVPGDDEERFFRGSGTSQAAAVVSGSAALLLQARPQLTPDQIKRALLSSAQDLPAETSPAAGAGALDVAAALTAPVPSAYRSRQAFQPSTGTGSLELSRGGSHAVDPDNGTPLVGEVDALGNPWDAEEWSAASARGTSWSGGSWNGRRWSGDSWTAHGWAAALWSGANWAGVDWQARRWTATTWTARRWTGADWSARRWTGSEWSARRWTGDTWEARRWTSSSW